jgi:sugar O-acyltransferase (sialic acid O-acetyltransferase NeuD family)
VNKNQKLVIIGDSAFAEVAYEFFTNDSTYEVVAFSVEQNYLKRKALFDLPVVPFENLEELYPPSGHHVFVAVVFTQANRLRTRLYLEAKGKGYQLAFYVSSHALVPDNAQVGEHSFICEATVVQPHAKIGDNVVLWSGNQISHHAVIKSNCFTLPHAVVCEFAQIGENCVIGANATILANVKIGDDCHVAAGALIEKDINHQPESDSNDA